MPVFIPDLIPNTDVENIPSHGWRLSFFQSYGSFGMPETACGVIDPHGNEHHFPQTEIFRACAESRTSGGLFLDRLCVGQDGKKIIPLVEGSPRHEEAVGNTRQKNKPLSMSELVPGTIYVSDKNEKFMWAGEVYMRNLYFKDGQIRAVDKKVWLRLREAWDGCYIAAVTKKITAVKTVSHGGSPLLNDFHYHPPSASIASTAFSYTPFPAEMTPVAHTGGWKNPEHFHDGQHCYFHDEDEDKWYKIHDDMTVEEREPDKPLINVEIRVKSGDAIQCIRRLAAK